MKRLVLLAVSATIISLTAGCVRTHARRVEEEPRRLSPEAVGNNQLAVILSYQEELARQVVGEERRLPRKQLRLVEAWTEIHLSDSGRTGSACKRASHSRSSPFGRKKTE